MASINGQREIRIKGSTGSAAWSEPSTCHSGSQSTQDDVILRAGYHKKNIVDNG